MEKKVIAFRCGSATDRELEAIAKETGLTKSNVINMIIESYLNRISEAEEKRIADLIERSSDNILQCLRVLYRLEFMTDDEKRRFGAAAISKRLSEYAELLSRIWNRISGEGGR